MKPFKSLPYYILIALSAICVLQANADSRILATGGLNNIEGVAGGGITPWAVISGYSSTDEWGFSSSASRVELDDFRLDSYNFSVSYDNRIELGLAKQNLDVVPLGLDISQDIVSAKVRVFGDLMYTDIPQISVGLVHKSNNDFTVPELLGAESQTGTDYYVAASKLFLNGPVGYNWLTNVTFRYSDANQNGLLGFGSQDRSTKAWLTEASIAFLPTESIAVGVEYRQQPDGLSAVDEDSWKDFFVGWFINKNVSVTAAYVDLGSIAGIPQQKGYYINLQGYF